METELEICADARRASQGPVHPGWRLWHVSELGSDEGLELGQVTKGGPDHGTARKRMSFRAAAAASMAPKSTAKPGMS